jgi:hypothetical protein
MANGAWAGGCSARRRRPEGDPARQFTADPRLQLPGGRRRTGVREQRVAAPAEAVVQLDDGAFRRRVLGPDLHESPHQVVLVPQAIDSLDDGHVHRGEQSACPGLLPDLRYCRIGSVQWQAETYRQRSLQWCAVEGDQARRPGGRDGGPDLTEQVRSPKELLTQRGGGAIAAVDQRQPAAGMRVGQRRHYVHPVLDDGWVQRCARDIHQPGLRLAEQLQQEQQALFKVNGSGYLHQLAAVQGDARHDDYRLRAGPRGNAQHVPYAALEPIEGVPLLGNVQSHEAFTVPVEVIIRCPVSITSEGWTAGYATRRLPRHCKSPAGRAAGSLTDAAILLMISTRIGR